MKKSYIIRKIMKKKLFLTAAVLGIVAIAAINVQLNSNKNMNLLLVDNIEALSQESDNCNYRYSTTTNVTWDGSITDHMGRQLPATCSKTVTSCVDPGLGSTCCTAGETPATCVAK
jgi:hypothetical protein